MRRNGHNVIRMHAAKIHTVPQIACLLLMIRFMVTSIPKRFLQRNAGKISDFALRLWRLRRFCANSRLKNRHISVMFRSVLHSALSLPQTGNFYNKPLLCGIRGHHRSSPFASSHPRRIFIHWIAAPDAPFPRLSNCEETIMRSSFPVT